MSAGTAAILSVAAPLAGAPLLYVLGRRWAGVVVPAVLVGVAVSMAAVVGSVWREGPRHYALGGWRAPLGIELNVDGLAALLLASTAAVMAAVCLYAARPGRPLTRKGAGADGSATADRDPPEDGMAPADHTAPMEADAAAAGGAPFWSLFLFLWAALNALFLSADLFNLYVTLELLGLSAVAMVALGGGAEALAAAMRYLLVSWLGSMAYLLGVAFLYAEHGSLALHTVAASASTGPSPGAWIALVAMTLGLALKTALFPFHGWLPAAHASAPSAVSALLSGLVVKASFYVMLRLWVSVFPGALAAPLVQFVGVLGAVAIVWGALLAMRQPRLKMILAFSTVSQLGYLFVLLPVALGGGAPAAIAWMGGVYHAVSHAVAKAAMFLAAGAVIHALGHDRVEGFTGLAERSPATVLAFALAGLSLIGLPPTGGFLAKWWLIEAALVRGQWGWALVMLGGSLLTAVYVFGVLGRALRSRPEEAAAGPGAEREAPLRAIPWTMSVAPLALALVAVALGHWAVGPLRLLAASTGFPW